MAEPVTHTFIVRRITDVTGGVFKRLEASTDDFASRTARIDLDPGQETEFRIGSTIKITVEAAGK